MASYDQFLHRLNLIPPQADKLLRNIRQLDQEVEQDKLKLQPMRERFLEQLHVLQERKNIKMRHELEHQFQRISKLESEIETKSREKINISQKLYNLIHEPTEKLEKQLQQRGIDKSQDDFRRKRGKKCLKKSFKKGEWEYDPKEPKYCYCGRPSFGEMVMCDNTFCERQWFHLECLDEKKLPEKWFCRNCRGQPEVKTTKKGRKK